MELLIGILACVFFGYCVIKAGDAEHKELRERIDEAVREAQAALASVPDEVRYTHENLAAYKEDLDDLYARKKALYLEKESYANNWSSRKSMKKTNYIWLQETKREIHLINVQIESVKTQRAIIKHKLFKGK